MADTSAGILSATQLNTLLDSLATVLKNSYANLGLGSPGESSTTFASLTKTARGAILGDGSTTYGIGNAAFQARIKDPLYGFVANSRYDSIFATRCKFIMTELESWITGNLPSGLVYTSSTQKHPLDAYLLRLNAVSSSTPTTPASAGVLLGTTVTGGGLPTATAGNATYVRHTLISSSGDWYESLPSPEATRVALVGSQNSFSYTIAGNVPTGVSKMCIYRGYFAGASGTEYLDQIVTGLVPGSAYPVVTIKNPDYALNTFWLPPSWLQCPQSPETAAIFGLAFAVANTTPGQSIQPLVFSSAGMLTPQGIFLTPSNGFLGIGNQPQSGIFGTQDTSTTYVAGAINTTNNYSTNSQAFAGAYGANCVRARASSVLGAAGTTAITYSYYDQSHGFGNGQTATSAAATFSGTAVGSTATYTITAGRLVYAVTANSLGGGLSSGNLLIEAAPNLPRSY